ncbi:MAG: NADH:flavin oxidoreductase [Hyphomonadaceae bacterium]|nr:NADH:flavin oxidoreductase [Hyphomonadaceae bacterium]
MSKSKSKAFTPLTIGPLKLRNRFIKAATNEGMCKGGIISKGLVQFHERVAEGGAAMSTVAYCATSKDGQTFVDQAHLSNDTVADFKVLTDAVHKHGAAAQAQITHAGAFTFLPKDFSSMKPISANGGFNKFGVMTGRYMKKKMDRDDMDAIADEFVKAALHAKESGFDAVEIHMGHGYLLAQFITPFYNTRTDEYGGNIHNRMKFPAEVLSKVLDAVGNDLAVTVKYSQTDGKEGGNTVTEGIEIAKVLQKTGAHMAQLSNGLNVESISTMFGNPLPASSVKPKNLIVRLGMMMQPKSKEPDREFTPLYSMPPAKQIRAAVDMPLCYLGGLQNMDNANTIMDEGFDAMGLGRALIFDPGLINALQSGNIRNSGCTACNQCVTLMYTPGGTACVEDGGHKGHAPELNTQPASTA